MKSIRRYAGRAVFGLICWWCASAIAAETDNPHIVTQQTSPDSCNRCHIEQLSVRLSDDEPLLTKNVSATPTQFHVYGVKLCTECHNPDAAHKLGIKIDFEIPADLPLDENRAMTCHTCHYMHGSLTSDRPQASYCFMDRLIDSERLKKSFLLRRNNVDGELCLTCHQTSKGSR